MTPYFSILIPVYNVAPYLRECLDSVLAQTFTGWEAICVDDGSTDNSGAILDEYAANDKRFRVIHQANAGVSAARNAALDVAQGDWIGFVDGDDAIAPNWLDTAREVSANEKRPDWIRFWYKSCKVGKGSLEIANIFPEGKINFINEENVVEQGLSWMLTNSLVFLHFYRREILGKVRFPVGVRFREDDVQQFETLINVKSAVEMRFPGYYYREDREGAATRKCSLDDSVVFLKAFLNVAKKWRALRQQDFERQVFKDHVAAIIQKDFLRAFSGEMNSRGHVDRLIVKAYLREIDTAKELGLFNTQRFKGAKKILAYFLFQFGIAWPYELSYFIKKSIKRIINA